MKTKKKRNYKANDATLINVQSAKRREAKLQKQIDELTEYVGYKKDGWNDTSLKEEIDQINARITSIANEYLADVHEAKTLQNKIWKYITRYFVKGDA